MPQPGRVRFAIDRGGTFTDIYAEIPGSPGWTVLKLLSEDPSEYEDAPREGIRRILKEIPSQLLQSENPIEWIRMGTTLATNALLQRNGARCALVITQGFLDLLRIGKQNRPRIFDLKIQKPEMVYETVIEAEERVRPLKGNETVNIPVYGVGGERFEIIQPLNKIKLRKKLREIYEKGIESLAVVCLHSYAFPTHEILIGDLARELGFDHVYLSHQTIPRIKMVERGHTTCVEAYLNPVVKRYLKSFRDGFDDDQGPFTLYMQSDGGLVDADQFTASRSLLSGPAGGVVGYAKTTMEVIPDKPVIGFDMGGTSTDVSRYDGEFDWTQDNEIAGIFLQIPQLKIHTVAAGGGSRLFFRNRLLQVGPESTGAHPGPVCYRKNGDLSLTDGNLVLGRLLPEFFPKIFGPQKDQPLDTLASKKALQELTQQINQEHGNQEDKKFSMEDVAQGFIQIANETMARAIRDISVAKGFDIRDHVLACFGGAGGQHACALARALGISKIFIHRFSGVLSAYGMGLADVVEEKREPASILLEEVSSWKPRLEALKNDIEILLKEKGVNTIELQSFLSLRYEGTDTVMMIRERLDQSFESQFLDRYVREFEFNLLGRKIWVDEIQVRGVGKSKKIERQPIPERPGRTSVATQTRCYFDSDWIQTPVYVLEQLGPGERIDGPALLVQDTSTLIIETACHAEITKFGDVVIELQSLPKKNIGKAMDPIQLSIFANRFMSIAEQMGYTLQRTAISVNIRERQDYSCALFDAKGNLVANAPHLPVHLGAMGEAVKQQIEIQEKGAQPGDVWVTNHPGFGGSHLPDITVISPVFYKGKPVFYVANRGHHADIGGATPGSMPPFSKSLNEEGVCIKSIKLVEGGVFQENLMRDLLTGNFQTFEKGKQIGTRALEDNLSDLKAQVASNKRGMELLIELVDEYGFDIVQSYMQHIQQNAEKAVRSLLMTWNIPDVVEAEDYMDDGTAIHLKLTLDRQKGEAIFDFAGTGPQSAGNINTPRAVTLSAILYSLRCLIENDIPLNQGCLKPIRVLIPEGSLLFPEGNTAVCGGNVLTSQRITDVILKAFGAAAASQGCMNNLTFGNERFGYYETIGGGAGAGPGWNGQSGIHTHMTNTRITDPEILEKYYPVLLMEFSIRLGSGGEGRFRGGDGLIREFEFLKTLDTAILSERRCFPPFGLAGGMPGKMGQNLWIRKEGETIDLGGKNQFRVNPGDRLRILTPGGGGFGDKI